MGLNTFSAALSGLSTNSMLGAGLIVGVIISILQIITSIHDTALAFVPRIVVTFVVFLIVFPWMMTTMVSYTHSLLTTFDPYLR